MIRARGIAMTFGVISFAATTCSVGAQVPSPKTPRAALAWFQEERERSAAHQEQLQEMFYRHAMSLPVDVSHLVRLTEAEAAVSREQAEEELRRTRQGVQELIRQCEDLELQVQSARAKLAAATKTGRQGPRPDQDPRSDQEPRRDQEPGRDREGGSGPRPRRRRPATRPSGPVMLIEGSSDRGLVGRALFRAGKYESAIRELLPLTRHDDADFSNLFHLALSYEKLARQTAEQSMLAKANDLFSRIEARDSHESKAGALVLGEWGRAARTARQTMLWFADRGQWHPEQDVEAIRWETVQGEPRGER